MGEKQYATEKQSIFISMEAAPIPLAPYVNDTAREEDFFSPVCL